MAWIDLRCHRFTQRPPTTLKLLPDKYFDLWLSIDTKNSPLFWYTFAATSCQMTMVKNENFQAQNGQNFKFRATDVLYISKES